jgi:hypothetical protein
MKANLGKLLQTVRIKFRVLATQQVSLWVVVGAIFVTGMMVMVMASRVSADQPEVDGDPATQLRAILAASPLWVSYQARLADPTTGNPKPNGNYNVVFSLYDVDSGGIALWTESKSVEVVDGVFSTNLGDTSPLLPSLFNGQALWLGIKVESDAEASPRQQITVVPYAASLVPGAEMVGDLTRPIISVTNDSTASSAYAIYGSISPTAAGGNSTSIRGEHFGTTNAGIGVWGSHDGSGWGVYGEAPSGRGVYGSSSTGVGVYAQSNTGDALYVDGNAHVAGDLTVNGAFNHQMVPIAFANIRDDGTKASGTASVLASFRRSDGGYEIIISGESYVDSRYITNATLADSCRPLGYTIGTASFNGRLLIFVRNSSGIIGRCGFQFVTYKP